MKKITCQKGFTLIEMMVVLLIISVLVLIAIPNVTQHSATIDEKGCEAYVKMIEGQVEAYQMDLKVIPTIDDLETAGYITETSCPNGDAISIVSGTGEVTVDPAISE